MQTMCKTNLHKNIWKFAKQNTLCSKILDHQKWFEIPHPRIITLHHKLHDLVIIVLWNLFFIVLYGIDMNVIHLFAFFEYQCHTKCLNTNVMCLFVLFKHEYCMSIHVVYRWKSCTWLLCLNNAWHSYLNNMNLWNNRFHTNLKWTHEAYKFVM
jgi:hypothetical protein